MTFVIWKKIKTCDVRVSNSRQTRGANWTYSVIGSEELGQDTGEQLDLARAADELVVDHRARVDLVLDALEQERVLADLAQLHKLVAETLDTTRFPLALKSVSATTMTG